MISAKHGQQKNMKGAKMATYEEIAKANTEMTLTPIKDKKYAEVPQRINAFRKVYPNGSITTEIISLENGVCVIKATAADEAGNILGTGHAYEVEGSSFINKGSYIENCETSAWGRCLAACGFLGGASVASADELQNALEGQKKISPEDIGKLRAFANSKNVPIENILSAHNLKRIEDMTNNDYVRAIRTLREMR